MNNSLLRRPLLKTKFLKVDVRLINAKACPQNEPRCLKADVRQKQAEASNQNESRAPQHLIRVSDWTPKMVRDVLISASNLKKKLRGDSHFKKLEVLHKAKVMILQEENEPMLNSAVSKAATLLGAEDINIISPVAWDHDYNGKIFSEMADVIFVTTNKYMSIWRFAMKSSVPVICMKSRAHASIQSLSTIMSIMEEHRSMKGVNVCYIGPSHQILNTYLLLCPILGANIKYKNCCAETPVSTLVSKESQDLCGKTATVSEQCLAKSKAMKDANVIIAGPTATKEAKIPEFEITIKNISEATKAKWFFYHTCPRGKEVADDLFWHENARTFTAFQNMQYISAALMLYTIKNLQF